MISYAKLEFIWLCLDVLLHRMWHCSRLALCYFVIFGTVNKSRFKEGLPYRDRQAGFLVLYTCRSDIFLAEKVRFVPAQHMSRQCILQEFAETWSYIWRGRRGADTVGRSTVHLEVVVITRQHVPLVDASSYVGKKTGQVSIRANSICVDTVMSMCLEKIPRDTNHK